MSFFDQPYYSTNKILMSYIGIWPEQSRTVRILKLLAVFLVHLTLAIPMIIRLHNVWGDFDAAFPIFPMFMYSVINFATVTNSIRKVDKMKLMLEKIKTHWQIFGNTSAVTVLEKYAERGRCLVNFYRLTSYIVFPLYCVISMSPIILDAIVPLNETRPKNYPFETEYGVDHDQYYWFIFAHGYLAALVGVHIFLAIDTMYIMWVAHACALFEIVGFNLKLLATERIKSVAVRSDEDYRKIRDCIIIHKEAIRAFKYVGILTVSLESRSTLYISFAIMIENLYSGSMVVVVGVSAFLISITGVQAVMKMGHPDIVVQWIGLTLGETLHLYLNCLPGQKLMEHSLKIHTFAFESRWYDMSTRAQKLLILILIRSKRPCLLTAGKVYVISLENFASVMQKAVSYLMVFTGMLQ